MKKKILEYISNELCFEDETVSEDTPLFSSRILDSMCLLELVTFLEENTGIKISPADLVFENFDSVVNIVDFLNRRSQDTRNRNNGLATRASDL